MIIETACLIVTEFDLIYFILIFIVVTLSIFDITRVRFW